MSTDVLDHSSTPQAGESTSRRAHREHGRSHPPRTSHTGRYLLIGIAAWLFLGIVLDHLAGNMIVRGAWMLLGAALVPSALVWAMAHRLRDGDTLTPVALLRAFLVGGFFSFLIGASLDTVVSLLAPGENGPSLVSYALSGVIEEAAKASLVIFLGWHVAKTVRNGLFLGGAVGAGFALFETLGYIDYAPTMIGGSQAAIGGGFDEFVVTIDRALTMPLGHPLWAALLGAALFAAAAKTGRFRITLGVLGAYLGVAVGHGLWDSGRVIIGDLVNAPLLSTLSALPISLALGVIGGLIWLRVARRSQPTPAR